MFAGEGFVAGVQDARGGFSAGLDERGHEGFEGHLGVGIERGQQAEEERVEEAEPAVEGAGAVEDDACVAGQASCDEEDGGVDGVVHAVGEVDGLFGPFDEVAGGERPGVVGEAELLGDKRSDAEVFAVGAADAVGAEGATARHGEGGDTAGVESAADGEFERLALGRRFLHHVLQGGFEGARGGVDRAERPGSAVKLEFPVAAHGRRPAVPESEDGRGGDALNVRKKGPVAERNAEEDIVADALFIHGMRRRRQGQQRLYFGGEGDACAVLTVVEGPHAEPVGGEEEGFGGAVPYRQGEMAARTGGELDAEPPVQFHEVRRGMPGAAGNEELRRCSFGIRHAEDLAIDAQYDAIVGDDPVAEGVLRIRIAGHGRAFGGGDVQCVGQAGESQAGGHAANGLVPNCPVRCRLTR